MNDADGLKESDQDGQEKYRIQTRHIINFTSDPIQTRVHAGQWLCVTRCVLSGFMDE